MAFQKRTVEEDFTQIVDDCDVLEFGKKMFDRIMKQTEILANEKDELDLNKINRILAYYAKYNAWLVVESERLTEMFEKTKLYFDDWYKMKYAEATRIVEKPIAAVEAKVVEMCKHEYDKKFQSLLNQGKDAEMVRDEMKYEGLTGRRMYMIELERKVNIAKNYLKIWEKEISALQTLSRNITIEMELVKRGIE